MSEEEIRKVFLKHGASPTDPACAAATELIRTALARNIVDLLQDAKRYRAFRTNIEGHTPEQVDAHCDQLRRAY